MLHVLPPYHEVKIVHVLSQDCVEPYTILRLHKSFRIISWLCANLKIGMQFKDTTNGQCNLKILDCVEHIYNIPEPQTKTGGASPSTCGVSA